MFMKLLILLFFLTFVPCGTSAQERFVQNNIDLALIKERDLHALVKYFNTKRLDPHTPFPEKTLLPLTDLHTLYGISGIHRVLQQGNDSLHQLQVYVKIKGKTYRYGFNFTVTPPLETTPTSFSDFFHDRKLTQYYIWRIEDGVENEIQTLALQSNTDMLLEGSGKSRKVAP